ncbi:MAG: serine/threonine-protein kinase [Syntrophotaleaceae bacterium]
MLQPGPQLGRYRILQKLGAGGMADVFLAEDTTLGRQVALKVLPPELARDPERIARFEKEVRASAALHHPNIVTLFEVGHTGSSPYYAMALLSGGDLKQKIRAGLHPEQALEILRQLADALDYAHVKGFVHRDIKPENILFDERDRPILTDLGIAKALGSGTQMTKTGMSIGTPHYMSPEQARGQAVDGRSDLYSLGVVLYEMLTGRVPFDAQDSFAVAYAHINEPVPRLPQHLEAYQGLIDGLLAKSPEQRFGDAGALMVAVGQVQTGQMPERPSPKTEILPQVVIEEVGESSVAPSDRGAGKNRGLQWGIAGALLALLLVGGIWLAQRTSPSLGVDGSVGVTSRVSANSDTEINPQTSPLEDKTPLLTDQESHAEQKRRRVGILLEKAQIDLQKQRLTKPVGNCAFEKYEEILRLDPGNQQAIGGLDRIADAYETLGQRELDRHNQVGAVEFCGSFREVVLMRMKYSSFSDARSFNAWFKVRHSMSEGCFTDGWGAFAKVGQFDRARREINDKEAFFTKLMDLPNIQKAIGTETLKEMRSKISVDLRRDREGLATIKESAQ